MSGTTSRRLLKLIVLWLTVALVTVYSLTTRRVQAYSSGPPPSFTGAPGEEDCLACHGPFVLNSGPGTFKITGLPISYAAGQEYVVTVTLKQVNRALYGFELTALDETGKQAGTFTLTDAQRMQLKTGTVESNPRTYIEHTRDGNTATAPDQNEWSFKWIAPPVSTGTVTFYGAGNAADGNGTSIGDYIYTTTATVQPQQVQPNPVASVSAASFAQSAALSADSIVAAFGPKLSTQTAVAQGDADPVTPGIQLPLKLGGTTVKVKDSAGIERTASLFFVSPTQLNYLVPADTATGTATVTVTTDDGLNSTGTILIATAAPALFSANATGNGVAAASVVRVRQDGSQTFEPAYRFEMDSPVPVPIDLGPETDRVFLILFGTSIRHRSTLAAVSAKIAGVSAAVDFAGAQGSFAGLDQVNLLIPRNTARNEVEVLIRVAGIESNHLKLSLKP